MAGVEHNNQNVSVDVSTTLRTPFLAFNKFMESLKTIFKKIKTPY
jgi:hypothetical protein